MIFSKSEFKGVPVVIDGKQLSYPGTGLALVTAELLQAFQKLGCARSMTVFIEESCDLGIYSLNQTEFRWIRLRPRRTGVDYIDRLLWAKSVTKNLHCFDTQYKHFIPYLYNYGNIRQNVVLIPDLVYKIFPDYGAIVVDSSWWNLRGNLPVRPFFRWWEEQRATSANQIIVYSEFVKHHVHQELCVPLNKITVVPLATPSWVTSQYEEAGKQAILKSLQIPSRFVLYVGGFANRKNIPLLLRACGKIYAQDPSFRCVFVGLTETIVNNDPKLFKEMQDFSVKQSAICTPKLSYPDLSALYKLAEFTVYPSITEGFGLPILEAAAVSKLCLCGDNSSMQEIQTSPQYRIDAGNEQAWVQQILYFWENPEISKQAGEACQQICQKYSWQTSAKQILEIMQG